MYRRPPETATCEAKRSSRSINGGREVVAWARGEGRRRMKPVSVVLADDVEDVRYLFRVVIEADGRFEVVGEATTGREAVDLARSLQPDVILLDLAMPEMGGLEALPLIKVASPTTQVVVATAFGELSEQAAYERGAVAFVTKGAKPGQLVDVVADVVATPPGCRE